MNIIWIVIVFVDYDYLVDKKLILSTHQESVFLCYQSADSQSGKCSGMKKKKLSFFFFLSFIIAVSRLDFWRFNIILIDRHFRNNNNNVKFNFMDQLALNIILILFLFFVFVLFLVCFLLCFFFLSLFPLFRGSGEYILLILLKGGNKQNLPKWEGNRKTKSIKREGGEREREREREREG